VAKLFIILSIFFDWHIYLCHLLKSLLLI
jgi:hypothetical protein